jgi:hypothetical protein
MTNRRCQLTAKSGLSDVFRKSGPTHAHAQACLEESNATRLIIPNRQNAIAQGMEKVIQISSDAVSHFLASAP